MTGSTVLNVILGVVAIGAGLLIVRHRKKLNDQVRKAQERMFGRTVSRVSAGRQTPFVMGIVGVLVILIGAAAVVAAVARIYLTTR